METSGEQFDIIIIGAGIIGSCAAYAAAKRNQKVLLLEQFDLLHHLGSSHGESRTIRATYPEPYYPPMVLESARLWEEAQSEIGYRVLTKTRHFVLGQAHNKRLLASIASSDPYITHQTLDQTQVPLFFPSSFLLPDGWIGIMSELGGVIKPTKAVAMFQTLALENGVVVKDRIEVTSIEKNHVGIRVLTAGGDQFLGRKCIVAVGAWTRKLVESVNGVILPIQPLHTTICYWKVKEGYEKALSLEGGFPTFAIYGEACIYGTPSFEFPGLIKIALDGGKPCDPDERDWGLSASGTMVDVVKTWIERVLPECVEVEKPIMTQACMYSMTPDEDYVIDFLGGEFGKDVVVAGGFSGHGFKMAPLVGRMLAEMAIDGEVEGVEMKYFKIGRFEDDPRGNYKEFQHQVI